MTSPEVSQPCSAPATRQVRRYRWLFRGVVLLLGWGLLECVSYVILLQVKSEGIPGVRDIQKSLKEGGTNLSSYSETFHPYFGWTHNPEVMAGPVDCCDQKLRVNRFGFIDATDGIHRKSPDKLIVAIGGGSVAWQMSCAAESTLKSELQQIPAYQGREVIIVRLAQSGFKQPQALFALQYYLLMGGQFDLVLNLDGFNELALAQDNSFSATALDYPQGWNIRTHEIVDPRDTDFSLRIFELKGLRQRSAIAALSSPLRVLPSYQLVWLLREERRREELTTIQGILLKRRHDRQGAFIHTGPHPLSREPDDLLNESIRIWKEASLNMDRLCQAHGIEYFHAIQPNQYDSGSKPFSEYELQFSYNKAIPYFELIQSGYPALRRAAEELRSEGVRCIDLTRIFEHVDETLYIDPYCHVNTRGSERIAEAFMQSVRASLNPK